MTPGVAARSSPARLIALVCVALLLIGTSAGVVIEKGLHWDFATFYDAGHKVSAGQPHDLYKADAPIAGEPSLGNQLFWGSPLSAVIYVPLSWLPPRVGLVVFKIENTLAYFAGLLLLYILYRRFDAGDSDRYTALFAFLALTFQPFWTVYRFGGQTTATVFLLFVLALGCHLSDRALLTAILLVVAVAIKPAFAPVVAFLALVSGRRFLAAAVVAGLAAAMTSVAAMGWQVHVEFLRQVVLEGSQFRSTVGYHDWISNSALILPLEGLRPLAGADTAFGETLDRVLGAVTVTVRLTAIALFLWLAWRAREFRLSVAARRHFHFSLALLLALMFSPVVWQHYLAVLFIPLVYLVAVRCQLPRGAQALLIAVFVSSLGQNIVLAMWVAAHVRVDGSLALVAIGLVKSSPLWLTLVLVWRYHEAWLETYYSSAWSAFGVQPSVLPGLVATRPNDTAS